MPKINWTALGEALKLPARLTVLAVIPFLVAYFAKVDYEWAGLASVILAVWDKYLHELWAIAETKKTENTKPIGLVPF